LFEAVALEYGFPIPDDTGEEDYYEE